MITIELFTATIGTGHNAVTQETAIALSAGKPIGQVIAKMEGRRVAEFKWLVVDQSARNEGVGSALLAFIEGVATEYGCESIACDIDSFNVGIVEWYRARGYLLAAELDDGTLFMAKDLRNE